MTCCPSNKDRRSGGDSVARRRDVPQDMCSGRLGHHSFCDCRNAHKDDEELEDRGIAAIWFDVVNGQKQHSGNEANAEDV